MLVAAGFQDIKITVKENGRDIVKDWIPGSGAENYVTSAYVTATKPRQAHGFRDGVFYGASAACCERCGVSSAAAAARFQAGGVAGKRYQCALLLGVLREWQQRSCDSKGAMCRASDVA